MNDLDPLVNDRDPIVNPFFILPVANFFEEVRFFAFFSIASPFTMKVITTWSRSQYTLNSFHTQVNYALTSILHRCNSKSRERKENFTLLDTFLRGPRFRSRDAVQDTALALGTSLSSERPNLDKHGCNAFYNQQRPRRS
jgi:hypothetical protein